MKYLLLAILLLAGCNSEKQVIVETEIIEPELFFTEIPLPVLTYRDSLNYNGQIDHINDNSWVFTSHTNNLCTYSQSGDKALKSPCRKVNLSYVDELATDRVVKTTVEFIVAEINLLSGMHYDIFWQEWFRRYPLPPVSDVVDINGNVVGYMSERKSKTSTKTNVKYFNPKEYYIDQDGFIFKDGVIVTDSDDQPLIVDSNGNHPITTLKLKIFEGVLNLCHYDNSWENGYDHGDNRDGDAIDVDHSLHQENTLNDCKVLYVGVSYNVEIINYDSGRFVFIVNDEVISDKEYQSKSTTSPSVIMIGHYFNKGFNIENNPLDRAIIRIDNLKLYKATPEL